jgi:hypothetical protein
MTTAARTITSVGDWLDPEYKRHAVDLLSALPLKRAEQPRRRRRLVSAILLRLAQINVAPVLSVLPQTGYQDATAVRRHARDRQHWSLSGLTGGLQQIAVAVESADPADPPAADTSTMLYVSPCVAERHLSFTLCVVLSARRPTLIRGGRGDCANALLAARYAGLFTVKPSVTMLGRSVYDRTRFTKPAGTFCAMMSGTPKPGLVGDADAEVIATLTKSSIDMPGV